MSPTCAWCGGWIDTPNAEHPGYCHPGCHYSGEREHTQQRAHKRKLAAQSRARHAVRKTQAPA